MGSAALYQLAQRGARVLGIDQYSPPHDLGSSHGDTRVTRLAIGEGAHYTPLAKRSHEIWRDIEAKTGADILTQCGGLIISSDNKRAFTHVEGFFRNTVDAANLLGIAHALLDATEIRRRFPAFQIRDEEFGYFEPDAGFVRPEVCVAAELALAEQDGAEIHRNERAMEFEATSAGVTVTTVRGRYEADTLIVAAGAWLPGLMGGDYAELLRVYRQVLYWFAVEGDVADFSPGRFPIFIWELPGSRQGIYGFPVIDSSGLKIATETYAQTTTPDTCLRGAGVDEIALMHCDYVAPYLKGVSARCTKAATCLYTVTPDGGFIIDRWPGSDRVMIASCCSGHGFKHSAAIGEVLADMAQGRAPSVDIAPFRLARFL
jgi:sarcosine oxidase